MSGRFVRFKESCIQIFVGGWMFLRSLGRAGVHFLLLSSRAVSGCTMVKHLYVDGKSNELQLAFGESTCVKCQYSDFGLVVSFVVARNEESLSWSRPLLMVHNISSQSFDSSNS